MTDNSTVRAARWIAGGVVASSLIVAGPSLARELRTTPAPPPKPVTLTLVKTEDGLYTDRYCIVGSDGAIHTCSPLTGGLTVYPDGEKPRAFQKFN